MQPVVVRIVVKTKIGQPQINEADRFLVCKRGAEGRTRTADTWIFKWMLGLPGGDEQIENYTKTIRNMAEFGLYFIILNMHALRIYRSAAALYRAG